MLSLWWEHFKFVFTHFYFENNKQLITAIPPSLLQLLCTIDDLKEMGIPLGPRKKLANFVKEKSAKQAYFPSLYCIRFSFVHSDVTLWNTFSSQQAARKAVKEKIVEKEEPKETQPPVQTEPTPDTAISKLPVGRNMSSIHVDYNYFEIGTGQVKLEYTPSQIDQWTDMIKWR